MPPDRDEGAPRFTEEDVYVPTAALREEARLDSAHVDGPLLTWAGRLHWLTRRERLALWLGWTTIAAIAARRWPDYRGWHQ